MSDKSKTKQEIEQAKRDRQMRLGISYQDSVKRIHADDCHCGRCR